MMSESQRRAVRLAIAATLFSVPALAVEPGFQVCASDFPLTPLQTLIYAVNVPGAALASITTEGYADASALQAGTTWDFTPMATMAVDDRVLQITPVSSTWSCSVGQACGTFRGADVLLVQDNYPAPPTRDVNALSQVGGNLIVLRAQIGLEGDANEVRACFADDIEFLSFSGPGNCLGGGTPAWPNSFSCIEGVRLGDACGTMGSQADIDGSIDGRPVGIGTLTLPSGHIVDAVLTETYANFDALAFCFINAGTIQAYLLSWVIPHYGPIAQLSSPGGDVDLSWTNVGTTTIGVGLLPPLDIQMTAVTSSSITVSWTPGVVPGTFGPDEYIVHWGTTAGTPTDSSEAVGDTIPASLTSYTISGLAPSTQYCISASTRAFYDDPVASQSNPPTPPTDYRSIVLPDTIGADIDGDGTRDTSYPPEVCVTTAGGAGPQLTLSKTRTSPSATLPGTDVTFDVVLDNVGGGSLTGGSVTDQFASCFDPLGSVGASCPTGPGAPSVRCQGAACATATCTIANGGLGFSFTGIDLAADDGVTGSGDDQVTLTVTVRAGSTLGPCNNDATTIDPNLGTLSAGDIVDIVMTLPNCALARVVESPPIVTTPPWVYTNACGSTNRIDNTTILSTTPLGVGFDTTDSTVPDPSGNLNLYQLDCNCTNDIYLVATPGQFVRMEFAN